MHITAYVFPFETEHVIIPRSSPIEDISGPRFFPVRMGVSFSPHIPFLMLKALKSKYRRNTVSSLDKPGRLCLYYTKTEQRTVANTCSDDKRAWRPNAADQRGVNPRNLQRNCTDRALILTIDNKSLKYMNSHSITHIQPGFMYPTPPHTVLRRLLWSHRVPWSIGSSSRWCNQTRTIGTISVVSFKIKKVPLVRRPM